MPICSFCKNNLPIENFSKKRNGHQASCKTCHSAYRKTHYQNNRQKYIDKAAEYKEKLKADFQKLKAEAGGCKVCGESTPCCLDFHHTRDKIGEVSQLINSVSWDKVLAEIEKCILLCANCHRKVHAGLIKLEN